MKLTDNIYLIAILVFGGYALILIFIYNIPEGREFFDWISCNAIGVNADFSNCIPERSDTKE